MSTQAFISTGQTMAKRTGQFALNAGVAVWKARLPLVILAGLTSCANPVASMLGIGPDGSGVPSGCGPYYDPKGDCQKAEGGLLDQDTRRAIEQQGQWNNWRPQGYGPGPGYGYGPGYGGYGGGGVVVEQDIKCKPRTGFLPNALLGEKCRDTGRRRIYRQYPLNVPLRPTVAPEAVTFRLIS